MYGYRTSRFVPEPLQINLQLLLLVNLHLEHRVLFIRLVQHCFEARDALAHHPVRPLEVVVLLFQFSDVAFHRLPLTHELIESSLVTAGFSFVVRQPLLQ